MSLRKREKEKYRERESEKGGKGVRKRENLSGKLTQELERLSSFNPLQIRALGINIIFIFKSEHHG